MNQPVPYTENLEIFCLDENEFCSHAFSISQKAIQRFSRLYGLDPNELDSLFNFKIAHIYSKYRSGEIEFSSKAAFFSYLWTVFRNSSKDLLRKRRNRLKIFTALTPCKEGGDPFEELLGRVQDESHDVLDGIFWEEGVAQVRAFINALESNIAYVLLGYLEGASGREIADRIGMKTASGVTGARKKLRNRLKREFPEIAKALANPPKKR